MMHLSAHLERLGAPPRAKKRENRNLSRHVNGKRANTMSVTNAWMHVHALQAGMERQTIKKHRKIQKKIHGSLSKISPKSVPGGSLRLPKSSHMRPPRLPGATLAPRPHFTRFWDPL